AIGMSPELAVRALELVRGVPDAQLTSNDWNFHAEMGQHMAWADSILHGGMQGRDYFSLYGPYLELGLVGLWKLAGRSLAALNFYVALQFVLGYLGLLALGFVLCRRKAAALALVPLARLVNVRIGLSLLALATLVPWVRGGKRVWCGLAGVVAGVALLTSQEFALAFLLSAA